MRFLLTDKLYLKVFSALAIGVYFSDTFTSYLVLLCPLIVLLILQLSTVIFKINRPKLIENLFFTGLIYVGILFHFFNFIVPTSNSEKLLYNTIEKSNAFLVRVDTKPEKRENSYKLKCQILSIKTEKDSFITLNQKFILYLKKEIEVDSFHYGDYLSINSRINIVDSQQNPYEFNYKKWLNRNKIYATSYVTSVKKVGADSSFLMKMYYLPLYLRDYFELEIEKFIKEPQSLKIAKSILIGVRSDFDQELLDAYSNTGTIHILSVSGLHFGVLIGFLGWILNLIFPKKPKLNFFLKQSLSFLYALITGFSPPVFRSFLMFLFLDIQKVSNIKTSSFNLLFLSATVILLYDTTQLFDIGFILSYAALLGIMIFYNKFLWKIQFKYRLLNMVWEATCVMTAAWIFTTPFTVYYFHKMTLFGILSNYIVLPIAIISMYLGFGLMILSKWTFVANLIGNILSYFIFIQNQVIFYFEKIPFSVLDHLYINNFELIIVILFIAFVSIFLYIKDKYSLRISILILFFLISLKSYDFYKCQNHTRWIYFKTTPFTTIGYINKNKMSIFTDSIPPKTYSFTIEPYLTRNYINSVAIYPLNSEIRLKNSTFSSNIKNSPVFLILCRENKNLWYNNINSRDSFILAENLGTYYEKKLQDTLSSLNKKIY